MCRFLGDTLGEGGGEKQVELSSNVAADDDDDDLEAQSLNLEISKRASGCAWILIHTKLTHSHLSGRSCCSN